MCDFSGRLIAWLDRELPEGEAAAVERHLQTCVECRSGIARYQQASIAFDAYCDLVIALEMQARQPRWMPVAAVVAALTAAVLLFATPSLRRIEQPPPDSQATHSSAANSPETVAGSAVATAVVPAVKSIKKAHRQYAVARVRTDAGNTAPTPIQNADLVPTGPAIEIAIPADAVYPPGAVPEGVNFIADLTVPADGTVQPLHLRPRLIALERRVSQP